MKRINIILLLVIIIIPVLSIYTIIYEPKILEKTLETPIDYLEYRALFMVPDIDNPRNAMRAEYSSFSDTTSSTYIMESSSEDWSDSIFIEHNGEKYMEISFWQIGDSGLTLETILSENTNERLSLKRIANISGLIPTTEDFCLNANVVCFKKQNTLIYAITIWNNNFEIVIDEIKRYNPRVFNIEIGVDGTIFLFIDHEQLMPPNEEEHYALPSFLLFIPIKLIDNNVCFWDEEPRICNLEQKVIELEKLLG